MYVDGSGAADFDLSGAVTVKNSANTDMNGDAKPFLHSFDIHYQSTNVATKNKAPNFNE